MEYFDFHTHKRPEPGSRNQLFSAEPEAIATTAELLYSLENHPWRPRRVDDRYQQAATYENVPLIGEIGLDFSRGDNPALQKEVFQEMLRLARREGKPVMIHSVGATGPVEDFLRKYDFPCVVYHGFAGKESRLREFLRRKILVTLGFRGVAKFQVTAADLPHIGLETDDDPRPIEALYALAAQRWGIPEAELAAAMKDNFLRLTGLRRD
ncbi:MAG: TatD family hydrolase [Victivallaceae bacterium]|nr:TatD family hydrolase [Victivallaceae bacterium]